MILWLKSTSYFYIYTLYVTSIWLMAGANSPPSRAKYFLPSGKERSLIHPNQSKSRNHDIIHHKNTPHLASTQGHFRPALTVHPSLCLFVQSDNWCTTVAFNGISLAQRMIGSFKTLTGSKFLSPHHSTSTAVSNFYTHDLQRPVFLTYFSATTTD